MRRDLRIALLTAGVVLGFGSGFHGLRMQALGTAPSPGSGTWPACAWTPRAALRPDSLQPFVPAGRARTLNCRASP